MFKSSKIRLREEAIYAKIAEELKSDTKDDALWVQAVAKLGNDKDKIESEYIKLRFGKLNSVETEEDIEMRLRRKKVLRNIVVTILVIAGASILIAMEEVKNYEMREADMKERRLQEWNDSAATVVLKKDSTELVKEYKFSDLKFKDAGQSYTGKVSRDYTSGKFIHATFMVTYIGTSTVGFNNPFSLSSLYLEDKEGKTFGGSDPIFQPSWTRIYTCKSLTKGYGSIEFNDEGSNLRLASNVPCEFNVLFEVAPDTVPDFVDLTFHTAPKVD